jgi:hypothetical protein
MIHRVPNTGGSGLFGGGKQRTEVRHGRYSLLGGMAIRVVKTYATGVACSDPLVEQAE